MTPKIPNKVWMDIAKCHGQGIGVSVVLDSFKKLKAELEALDCEVNITIDGMPLDFFKVVNLDLQESEVEHVQTHN